MSVVIIGGNECMECRYKNICKSYGCRAKIFTKEKDRYSLFDHTFYEHSFT